jgi:hypothetical protein
MEIFGLFKNMKMFSINLNKPVFLLQHSDTVSLKTDHTCY